MAQPDPVHSRITFEVIEMLRTFSEKGSFRDVARDFGCDERTIGRILNELSDAFVKTRQVPLLKRTNGRSRYELSDAGSMFVRYLAPVADAIRAAVDAVAEGSRWVPVPCTSNCLDDFNTLQRQIAAKAQFDIVQLPRRSADMGPILRSASLEHAHHAVSLFSALMPTEKRPQRGRVAQFSSRLKVLPLRVERFRLISVDDLGLGPLVSIEEVIEAGVALHVPSGGAAWDFLQATRPGWHTLRPYQHVDVPHLDYGVKCLASRTRPRAGMVVHSDPLPELGFVPRSYEFKESDAYHAVTGVFADQHVEDEDPGATIWQTACAIWLDPEVENK